jgi:hypothetical protein
MFVRQTAKQATLPTSETTNGGHSTKSAKSNMEATKQNTHTDFQHTQQTTHSQKNTGAVTLR